MTSPRDQEWALWGALRGLSTTQFDDLCTIARSSLPADLRAKLPASNATGRLRVAEELEAARQLPEADAVRVLDIWRAVAEQQLGQQFSSAFDDRSAALGELGRDRAVGAVAEKAKVDLKDDLVSIEWLAQGQLASASVGFITVPRYFANTREREVVGTCFVATLDRQHVMTAFHVIEARDRERGEGSPSEPDFARQVHEARISFDFVSATTVRGPALEVEAVVASDRTLDYAILRLAEPVPHAPLVLFAGTLPAIDSNLGFVANIVQHPMRDGVPQPKQLGLRNNAVWKYDTTKLYYFTDTRSGSSGAPVFSDGWLVYAIHTGYDTVSRVSYIGRNLAFANRGTLMRRVVEHASARLPAGSKLQVYGATGS